jgi:hypothetical protein
VRVVNAEAVVYAREALVSWWVQIWRYGRSGDMSGAAGASATQALKADFKNILEEILKRVTRFQKEGRKGQRGRSLRREFVSE